MSGSKLVVVVFFLGGGVGVGVGEETQKFERFDKKSIYVTNLLLCLLGNAISLTILSSCLVLD